MLKWLIARKSKKLIRQARWNMSFALVNLSMLRDVRPDLEEEIEELFDQLLHPLAARISGLGKEQT